MGCVNEWPLRKENTIQYIDVVSCLTTQMSPEPNSKSTFSAKGVAAVTLHFTHPLRSTHEKGKRKELVLLFMSLAKAYQLAEVNDSLLYCDNVNVGTAAFAKFH